MVDSQRQADVVTITPEMLDAGAQILMETDAWSRVCDANRDMAARIMTVMLSLAPTPLRTIVSPSVHKTENGLRTD